MISGWYIVEIMPNYATDALADSIFTANLSQAIEHQQFLEYHKGIAARIKVKSNEHNPAIKTPDRQ